MLSTIMPPLTALRVGMLGGTHSFGGLIFLALVSTGSAFAGVFGRRGKWISRDRPHKSSEKDTSGPEWKQTHGTVMSSRLVWNHIEVNYEFAVNGKGYKGEHKIRLTPPSPDDLYPELARRHEVAAVLARYPRGFGVIVRYNPANSEQSVLLEREETKAKSAGAG